VIGELLGGAVELATLIADKIAKETGLDKAKTYEMAIGVAREWVSAERKAVTEARAKAVKRVRK
jgi:hypothetical protein